jgi:hypothetical protein
MPPSHDYYVYSTWELCEINPVYNITYLQLFGIKHGKAESSYLKMKVKLPISSIIQLYTGIVI